MLLNTLFTRFVEKKPFTVMARATLERMLSANRLDELFRTHASAQYERELLFSQLVEVMARVVTRVDRSVLKAIQAVVAELSREGLGWQQPLRFRASHRRTANHLGCAASRTHLGGVGSADAGTLSDSLSANRLWSARPRAAKRSTNKR